MRKIFESKLYSYGDSETAERIHVYEFENDNEYDELYDMEYAEICEYVGVVPCGIVAPGDIYHHYRFSFESKHLIMVEIVGRNI
jgi:hypothetical protein